MVHSDKPYVWPMIYDDVQAAFDCGSLLSFYFASFSTLMTLLLSCELRNGRNSVLGNVPARVYTCS